MYVDKKDTHQNMKYEVSMTVYMGRIGKQKYQNGYHLKTISQNHKIFDVHIQGTYGHIHTKYEVSMPNPLARRGVHRG